MPDARPRHFAAHSALNDAIVAYHSATQVLFGGHAVERIFQHEWFDRLRYVHMVLCPPDYELSASDIVEIFDTRGEREFIQTGGQFSGELTDLDEATLAKVPEFVQRHRRFLFYQFALDAKARMVESDYVSAILFAVVALEGVHAALLQICLDRNLKNAIPDQDERAKIVEEKANKLLLDVGLSEMVEITSLVFLSDSDRPNFDDIRACKVGIKIRNEIMHALAKKGQYKLRNRTNGQIADAYGDVFKVYQHFAGIIERLLTP
jgi:hypothetical protein